MMKYSVSTLILILFCFNLIGQNDSSSIYKNLQIKKTYNVGLTSTTTGGRSVYKVNDKIVSKDVYDNYKKGVDAINECCPCILKTYDEKDVLLNEYVSCGDCPVGYYNEFYPDGKLKIKGQFKENPTENWKDIYGRGYCHVTDGKWLYYNEKGQGHYLHHVEVWDKGKFIKQIPESKQVEIWDVEFKLRGSKIDTQIISIKDVKNIEIVPLYKNQNRSFEIKIVFSIVAIGYNINVEAFSIDSFKNIDVKAMSNKIKLDNIGKSNSTLDVYDGNKIVKRIYLKLKE
jgi:hypothetical protein